MFEVNFVGYYLMAVAVALILLDVVSGRLRGSTVAWIALATAVFNPVPWEIHADGTSWGLGLYIALPITMLSVATVFILVSISQRITCWYLYGWTVLMVTSLVIGGWRRDPYGHPFPLWFWQIVLVSLAIRLASVRLASFMRNVKTANGPSVESR